MLQTRRGFDSYSHFGTDASPQQNIFTLSVWNSTSNIEEMFWENPILTKMSTYSTRKFEKLDKKTFFVTICSDFTTQKVLVRYKMKN